MTPPLPTRAGCGRCSIISRPVRRGMGAGAVMWARRLRSIVQTERPSVIVAVHPGCTRQHGGRRHPCPLAAVFVESPDRFREVTCSSPFVDYAELVPWIRTTYHGMRRTPGPWWHVSGVQRRTVSLFSQGIRHSLFRGHRLSLCPCHRVGCRTQVSADPCHSTFIARTIIRFQGRANGRA